jgi:predicted permease
MIGVFIDVLLPVVLIAGIGGALAHRARMPVAPLAALTFDVFSPALVFDSLHDVRTSGATVGRIVAVVVGTFAIIAMVSILHSRRTRQDRPTLAAKALGSAVGNMGNMGLPVATLAFGRLGLEVAGVAFVASSVLTYSGGVILASCASGPARTAFLAPLRVPALWAAVAALAFRIGGLPTPRVVDATASTLAGAAIPAMLIVLGLHVRQHIPVVEDLRTAVIPLGLRLCASPLITAALATVVGLDGVARRTMILLGGMPTAVTPRSWPRSTGHGPRW